MSTDVLSDIASGLAVWPGALLVVGGLAKARDVAQGADLYRTVVGKLLEGRVHLRFTWGLVAAAELAVGGLVLAGLAGPWPAAVAALLLVTATVAAVWGIRNAPEAGCGCFGAGTQAGVSIRTAVRAGTLAGFAALAAVSGTSWWHVFDHLSTALITLVAGAGLLWLSPDLRMQLTDAAAPHVWRQGARVRRLRDTACERRTVPLERTVSRLRRSELWTRAQPHLSAEQPTEHWQEGCWRLLTYPAVWQGEVATAVFAVPLAVGLGPRTVAFVDERNQRVLAQLRARNRRRPGFARSR